MLATGQGSDARIFRTDSVEVHQSAVETDAATTTHLGRGLPVPANDAETSARRNTVSAKIRSFLATHGASLDRPTLILDVDVVETSYRSLAAALPLAGIFYAMKANPAPEILRRLAALGSNFDAASWGEVSLLLAQGVQPHKISFGNTIKRVSDIRNAFDAGVRLFAFDSEEEAQKLAAHAPGAQVFCRILMDGAGAEWPLSKKFGCDPAIAVDLLVQARDLGLVPAGISFHIGSQQRDLGQWDRAIGLVAKLFEDARARGVELSLINLGGGFAGTYTADAPTAAQHGDAIMTAMRTHFIGVNHGRALPRMIVEPGRGLVADAGLIQAEVVLVARKGDGDDRRWVYLDIGKFHGLAETMEEAIKYRFETDRDGEAVGPVILAGPTCDSADVLYERTPYTLPLGLKCGDKIRIVSAGAYTTTYSSVAFNGFPPLESICL